MKITYALPLIMTLIVLVTIGGVFAIWQYAEFGPNPQKVEITVDMDEFDESLFTLAFTKVEYVPSETNNSPPTEIILPRKIKSTISGSAGEKIVYKVTAKNRSTVDKLYYIDATYTNSNVDVAVSWNEDGIGYFPVKAAPDEEIEFYVIYTLKSNISQSELTVDFNFEVKVYAVTYVDNGVILQKDYITEDNKKDYTLLDKSYCNEHFFKGDSYRTVAKGEKIFTHQADSDTHRSH